jgi:oligopeptide/dipeptide ABC transporter ATP-binding protein
MHSTRSSGEFVPEPVLSIRNLVVEFRTEDGVVHAVDDISYDVYPGETLGIVGESGSGKSVSTMSILGLIPQPPGRIASGTAMFKGKDLLKMKKRELRRVRGDEVAMIFQDPMTSMNPVLKVGYQLGEAIKTHYPKEPNDKVKSRVIDLLRLVGVPNPESRYDNYPHEFSGGMRQRAMIAMSIANSPSLLIADEPTTALDVTIQAQVLEVLKRVQAETQAATILITHDLGIVAELCERVIVMYGGKIVEHGDVHTIFQNPRHPYTIGLMDSLPKLTEDEEWLRPIPGQPPSLINRPPGCAFHPRCFLSQGRLPCREEVPALRTIDGGSEHKSACHFAEELIGRHSKFAEPVPAGGAS